MDKKQIRQNMMLMRSALTTEEREKYSEEVLKILIQLENFKKARAIASFVDFRNEVSMAPINDYILEANKALFLPYIDMATKTMTFHKVNDLSELNLSKFGILEPNPSIHERIDINTIDLVLTPGVAFDHTGHRLGYGGGFYDRFFEKLNQSVPRIGIAFSLQQIDKIPLEEHDLPLTGLITEEGLQWF